jgi:hypothetical protein
MGTRLAIAGPVWAGGVHAATAGGIVVRHVLRRRAVRRVLVLVAVRRARLCNGRIYGYIAVRLDLLGLMVASILQRHGRTCWCLRHTAAASTLVACGWICTLDMFRERT